MRYVVHWNGRPGDPVGVTKCRSLRAALEAATATLAVRPETDKVEISLYEGNPSDYTRPLGGFRITRFPS